MNHKTHIFFLYFLLFTLCSFSQPPGNQNINPDGYNKFYYDNGKISSEGTMKNGKPDGYWKTYLPNGKLKSEGNRKDFKLDSTWKFYDETGKLTTEINYKNDKKNGYKKTFDKEGKLISEINFKEDIKEGYSNYYYPSGKTKQKIPFVNDKEEGFAFEFSEDGNIITVTEFKVGFMKSQEKINRRSANNLKQGKWKEFYENGNPHFELIYLNDTLNGFCKEFNPDGTLKGISKYNMGNKEENVPELAVLDIRNNYYADGKIKSQETYKDGQPEGTFKYYDTLGIITSAKIYKEGILMAEGIFDEFGKEQGPWKELHPDGTLRGEGEYKDGMKVGDWKFYHPNGKKEQLGKYDSKGRPSGTWKWYYESGNILREEIYTKGLREGLMTEYSDSGIVITKGEFLDGLKMGAWSYQLGDYKEEGEYLNGERIGAWKHYYLSNGQLRFVGNYIDGQPEGKHKYYYENGKTRAEGKYAAGKKDGEWTYLFYVEITEGSESLMPTVLIITYKNGQEMKFDGTTVVPLLDISDIQ